ncbi:hypothetical protein [Acinetobacter sp. MB5]|uniref:hypothetical protein n=1 Tax=Acinetobacter sp. MB5 TaxID=2069438 RepID=UPI000DD099A3|nr:hypothetical protein [Acinetobacter sp. MB5]
MRLSPIKLFLLSSCLVAAPSVFAMTETQPSTPNAPLPDNPSLGRVILYKTGQTLERIGNATQRGADKASEKIQRKWDNTKAFGAETTQVMQEKASDVQQGAEKKWEQTKEVVTGNRSDTTPVPIEQKSLSQAN